MTNLKQTFMRTMQGSAVVLLLSATAMSVQAQEILIGALTSGQVSKLHVQEGQSVKKGQSLLTLDAERYQAKKASLEAQLKVSELRLADATIERDQALDLFDRTVTSRRALDAAKLSFDVAQAQVEKDRAALALHKAMAKYVFVKAPRAGTIQKLHVLEGSTVFEENSPLIELKLD